MSNIDFYYDFRSPFAYFAFQRRKIFEDKGSKINWKPVSVSALINLQANRQPLDEVIDPMSPAKRSHFMSDIFRLIEHWEIPFAPPMPTPPVCTKAMVMASILEDKGKDQEKFMEAIFKGVWQGQEDAENVRFLKVCRMKNEVDIAFTDEMLNEGLTSLIDKTRTAYDLKVFGTPTFIHDGQLYFGADRMELLASKL